MSWPLFGNRAASEVTEALHGSPKTRQDATDQTQALLTDKEKWQRSKQRWNADIRPADKAFKMKYNDFVEKLRINSPDFVIREDFSNHEVRKFLNGYVDKNRFKAIYLQQVSEKERYKVLLESTDYKDVQVSCSPLALKLTMMYFGLPVAPMTFADPIQSSGKDLFGNSVLSEELHGDEDRFDHERLSFVPEAMRPLRFLNYYDKRGYGRDNSHMNPEKTYELFYGIPMVVPTHELMGRMGLRGAGFEDVLGDNDRVADDARGADSTRVTVPIARAASTNSPRISPHFAPIGVDLDAAAGEQVFLWGLSGRTVFSYFDAKSFFSAIDRVLSLSKRGGGGASVGITISLLSHPRGQHGPCVVLASDQCFLGLSAENELNFYRTWLETVQYFDEQLKDEDALDICVAPISQDFHFSAMQKDLAYRPALVDDKVVSFALSDDRNAALSYFSMSHDVNRKTAVVYYQERFKLLWRMLSCPTKEQLKTYSIGSTQTLTPQSCLLRIKCANASEDDGHRWFFSEVGPTREAWDWFADAYHIEGHRDFVLDVIPMTDPRASSIACKVPIEVTPATSCANQSASDIQEEDSQCYWGNHMSADDIFAFQETDQPQLLPRPLDRPVQGVHLDKFAKGKEFREWSYAHPLSVHMQGQYPSIPINAPPLETMLKAPGINGLPSNSVPILSTQVLTPTEQRQLQETVSELRNLALNRAQPCPFRPCNKHFAIDDEGRQHFRDHVQSTHIDKKCPLCDDRMFGYYDEQTKQQHFYEKHLYYLSHKDDLHLNATFEVQSKELTHNRESKWSFCARCGRDHSQLNVNGDRAQHDNICFPGVTEQEAHAKYCVDCGVNTNSAAKHVCILPSTVDQDSKPVYCKKCALPTHKLAQTYAMKHLARCRGSNTATAQWCPWCSQNLAIYSRAKSYKHLDECSYKPPAGEGPINTTTGEPSDSPRDGRAIRYWEKQMHFTREGARNIIQVPRECLVKGCTKKNLQELHADALLDHYSTKTHANATDRLRYCPICNIDFKQRAWVRKQQKVDHFKDHVEEREKRIRLDLEIAKATDKLDEAVLAMIDLRNEDEFAPKSNKGSLQRAGESVRSLQSKKLDGLLEDQRRIKLEDERDSGVQVGLLDSLETKLEILMNVITDSFAHDRIKKRSRDPTPSTVISDASPFKKQRTASTTEPTDPQV